MNFKKWLEIQVLAGGLEPPNEYPIDTDNLNRNAFSDYHGPNSDELPPVKKKARKRKQPCRIKY